MSSHLTALKRSFLAAVLTATAVVSAHGQAADAPIVFSNTDGVKTSFVDPPIIGRSDAPPGDKVQWLKVEIHYACTPKDSAPFLDSAEFRIWIEGRDLLAPDAPSTDGVAVGLTGSVTYVNIPAGKDNYGCFYVHPSTLDRYSTKAGSTDFERKFNIHVEAYVGGNKVDFFDKNKETDPAWFSALKAVPNLVYRQDQCAFIVSDVTRYPAIRLPAAAAQ